MNITAELSDSATLLELGTRLARQRVNAGFTQVVLAREAGVAPRTVGRIEQGHGADLGTLIRLLRVLNLTGGVQTLIPDGPASPLAARRSRGRVRRRASSARTAEAAGRPWTWAE